MKGATLEKFHLSGGGIKILGTQGWEQLGGGGFVSLQAGGGGLILDDTMITFLLSALCKKCCYSQNPAILSKYKVCPSDIKIKFMGRWIWCEDSIMILYEKKNTQMKMVCCFIFISCWIMIFPYESEFPIIVWKKL